jgi:hypothetical protein
MSDDPLARAIGNGRAKGLGYACPDLDQAAADPDEAEYRRQIAAELEVQPMLSSHQRALLKRLSKQLADIAAVIEGLSNAGIEAVSHRPEGGAPAANLVPATTAKAMGFTGDMCDMCGSFLMVRTGTCLRCQNCGTSGGCS